MDAVFVKVFHKCLRFQIYLDYTACNISSDNCKIPQPIVSLPFIRYILEHRSYSVTRNCICLYLYKYSLKRKNDIA